MRAPLVLFGFAALACTATRAVPPAEPAPSVEPKGPSAQAAVVTACRASPSTVYGAEFVNFTIEASGPSAAPFELSDDRGRVVARGVLQAPTVWQAGALPSGDYSLRLGSSPVGCDVTVNRELSRQPAGVPK